jgi:hypothetical protein
VWHIVLAATATLQHFQCKSGGKSDRARVGLAERSLCFVRDDGVPTGISLPKGVLVRRIGPSAVSRDMKVPTASH